LHNTALSLALVHQFLALQFVLAEANRNGRVCDPLAGPTVRLDDFKLLTGLVAFYGQTKHSGFQSGFQDRASGSGSCRN
jgi:hypothetical protein